MTDWRELVRVVAPTVATALGGPLMGVAVRALSEALLGRVDGTEDEIAEAVAAAPPDVLLKLREADANLQAELEKAKISLAEIDQKDRASARGREVAAGDSFTPRALAAAVTFGFFGVLSWLLMVGVPEAGGDAVMVMLGGLGTAWAAIVAYYFGSSAGSRVKTEELANLARGRQ